MTNKEIYDLFVAELFAELYVNHPVPISRNITSSDADCEVKSESLRFLKENNHILFDQTMDGGYLDLRFTNQGLALLEITETESDSTNGNKLVKAISDGASSLAAKIVAQLIITSGSQ
ncbi:hypothetical protein OAI07_00360 [Akkermansiaceae bacterium]|nr:hypothetical protein [Akkermansiaceae bacterium]